MIAAFAGREVALLLVSMGFFPERCGLPCPKHNGKFCEKFMGHAVKQHFHERPECDF